MPDYQYLNLESKWPLFQRQGIEIGPDGELTLAHVPSVSAVPGVPVAPTPGLSGAVGVGVSACGDVYVADPGANRILRVDGCDGSIAPLPCLGGDGDAPGQLNTPRGVVVSGNSLLVADSGNRRVQVIDLATGQLRGVWGAGGAFTDPWDLAVDSHGDVYVADAGVTAVDGTRSGGRIVKLNASGRVSAGFTAAFAAQPTRPGSPIGVAIAMLGADAASERVLVLDSAPSALLVYMIDGTFDASATARWGQIAGASGVPVAVTTSADRLYVADGSTGQVLVFDLDGHFMGVASGTGTAVAGIALDCHGRLVVHPGGGGSVQVANGAPSFATCGTFLAGPFEAPHTPTRWWQLRATIDALPPLAHLRLFTLTSDTFDGVAGNDPDLPATCSLVDPAPSESPDTVALTPANVWRAAPWDAPDLLTLNEPARHLWIAGIMESDGTASPTIHQMRVDFDVDGWMKYLPAIFSRSEPSRVFLERALALFEVPFDDEHQRIEDIALLADPAASPDATPRPTWLEWLGGWVSSELEESWSDATRRRAVAESFALYAKRGTKETMRTLVSMHTGAAPLITELSEAAGPWSLGSVALGFETALVAESPDGAVLGSSAVVDHARLIGADDYGMPVFADVAHRFSVQLYSSQLSSAESEASVRRVLDREKPAHTTYHLCVIEPRMRVGLQSIVGVDAIVGGAPTGSAFDGTHELGIDMVLPDSPGSGGAPRVGYGVVA
ncbi:MAG TPA: phage tail protein [Gemmatimonadaceae bacterium]|nr:phage tail protein [Gemmatimonadaceae bacterium]